MARDEGRLSEVALPVWLELARCYSLRGQPRHAADVCLLGASANPTCAALWRVAGESFVAEGGLLVRVRAAHCRRGARCVERTFRVPRCSTAIGPQNGMRSSYLDTQAVRLSTPDVDN